MLLMLPQDNEDNATPKSDISPEGFQLTYIIAEVLKKISVHFINCNLLVF